MGNTESVAFPYTLGQQIKTYNSAFGWILHDAIDNATGKPVSVFSFNKAKHNDTKGECARNGMTLLRQMRHPFVLKYLNGVEHTNTIYIVTERVLPLTIPYSPPDFAALNDVTASNAALVRNNSAEGTGFVGGGTGSKNYNTGDDEDDIDNQNQHGNQNATNANKEVFTSSSLDLSLKPLPTNSPESLQLLLSAGLYQVFSALDFLNNTAGIVHGNINTTSIFISENGDWKIAGFDLAFKATGKDGELQTPNGSNNKISPNAQALAKAQQDKIAEELGLVPTSFNTRHGGNNGTDDTDGPVLGIIPPNYKSYYIHNKSFAPPEVLKNEWKRLQTYPIHIIDAYAMGELLKLLFLQHLKQDNVPPLFQAMYYRFHPNAPGSSNNKANNNTPQFHDYIPSLNLPSHHIVLTSPYFNNHVISALNFLDLIHIKSVEDKTAFFTQFSTIYTMFPTYILQKRIIPQLIASFDVITPKTAGISFGGILNSTFAVAKVSLPRNEYHQFIVPLIQKLFQSQDIEVRLSLLQNIHQYCEFLSIDMVFNEILPILFLGLYDSNAMIRELTILALIPFYHHFSKVKDGKYDNLYNNLAVISNKLYNDTYTYATTTLSSLASYVGYTQYMQQYYNANNNNNGQQNTTNSNSLSSVDATNNNTTTTPTLDSMGSGTTSSTAGGSGQPLTQQQIEKLEKQKQEQLQQQQLYQFKTLPSLYLSTIVFPILIKHYPEETSQPSIRCAIIKTLTLLSPLLSITQQETLLLTIFAKGVKDYHLTVRLAAFDGLLISLLTYSFTINTLCQKIIPFIAIFINDKDKQIHSRAIYIVQYCLYKITHQYYTLPTTATVDNVTHTGGGATGRDTILHFKDIIETYGQKYNTMNTITTPASTTTTSNTIDTTTTKDTQPYHINVQQLINHMTIAMRGIISGNATSGNNAGTLTIVEGNKRREEKQDHNDIAKSINLDTFKPAAPIVPITFAAVTPKHQQDDFGLFANQNNNMSLGLSTSQNSSNDNNNSNGIDDFLQHTGMSPTYGVQQQEPKQQFKLQKPQQSQQQQKFTNMNNAHKPRKIGNTSQVNPVLRSPLASHPTNNSNNNNSNGLMSGDDELDDGGKFVNNNNNNIQKNNNNTNIINNNNSDFVFADIFGNNSNTQSTTTSNNNNNNSSQIDLLGNDNSGMAFLQMQPTQQQKQHSTTTTSTSQTNNNDEWANLF